MKINTPSRTALSFTLICAIVATTPVLGSAQSSPSLVGTWRADTPLPNGIVQTFRFDADGTFDLSAALAVDGTYHTDGSQLIETVALPSVGAEHTDTATFTVAGDSLMINERAGAPARVLRRSDRQNASPSIVADWSIPISADAAAHYVFEPDGTMHVRAQVSDERGKYVAQADTLHLSNDKTFQLPAKALFAVTDSVLTLSPSNGKQPRQFHRIAPL